MIELLRAWKDSLSERANASVIRQYQRRAEQIVLSLCSEDFLDQVVGGLERSTSKLSGPAASYPAVSRPLVHPSIDPGVLPMHGHKLVHDTQPIGRAKGDEIILMRCFITEAIGRAAQVLITECSSLMGVVSN